jgi:hypothetical protein
MDESMAAIACRLIAHVPMAKGGTLGAGLRAERDVGSSTIFARLSYSTHFVAGMSYAWFSSEIEHKSWGSLWTFEARATSLKPQT